MKPSEIIAADAQANGLNTQEVLQDVAGRLESQTAVLLPKNNSVLLLTPLSQESAEWNLFTQDSGQKLEDSIAYFLDKLRRAKMSVIYSMADNDEAIQIIQSQGVEVMQSDEPEYDWMGRIA